MNSQNKENRWILFLLFAGGVAIHLLYLVALGLPESLERLQWAHADTETYVIPAQSFLRSGVFAVQGAPDSFRTIGYPLFLSGALKLGKMTGLDWRMIVYVVQAIFFALAYPAIYYLGRRVFRLSRGLSLGCVGFTVLSGAFISYTSVIMSDAIFATSLIVGMACGFCALRNRSIWWGLVHVAVITYAATVRPILAFYPFAAVCMHWAYLKENSDSADRFARRLMVAMFLVALIGVQVPAIRNWINYRVFTPSENGSAVLFDYLAKDVLEMKNQIPRYEQVKAQLLKMSDHRMLGERIAVRRKEALGVFRDYPLETAAFVLFNGIFNSLDMHWNNTFFYRLRVTWCRDYIDGSVRWSPLPFAVAMLFVIVYGCVYSASIILAFTLRKNLWVVCSVFLLLLPYIFCLTSCQGARFRLWFEPLLVLAAAVTIQKACRIWTFYRDNRFKNGTLIALQI